MFLCNLSFNMTWCSMTHSLKKSSNCPSPLNSLKFHYSPQIPSLLVYMLQWNLMQQIYFCTVYRTVSCKLNKSLPFKCVVMAFGYNYSYIWCVPFRLYFGIIPTPTFDPDSSCCEFVYHSVNVHVRSFEFHKILDW